MTVSRIDKPTLIWLILIAATVLSLIVGHGEGTGDSAPLATMVIVIVAALKSRLVILDFMELRSAWLPLRLLFEAWVVLVCSVIILLYLSGL